MDILQFIEASPFIPLSDWGGGGFVDCYIIENVPCEVNGNKLYDVCYGLVRCILEFKNIYYCNMRIAE